MRRVVSDADLRTRLADAGRKLIEEEYTFKTRMAKVKAIYDQLLDADETNVSIPKTPQIEISS